MLNGWFQHYRYYAPHAARIRAWVDVGPGGGAPAAADHGEDHRSDLLVHVRLGDFVPLGHALSPDFYRTLLRQVPHRRAYLMTDEPGHPTVAALEAGGVTRLAPGAVETFRAARGFGTLVVGQGTFGWWLAFLSAAAARVHVGVPEHRRVGSFSVSRIADGLDLRVDEDRYTYYYRAPLAGEARAGRLVPLGNFCGAHARSAAFLWE